MQDLTPVLALTAMFLAGATFCAGDEDASSHAMTPKGFISKTINLDGKDIKYVVYVPTSYDPAKPMPTIIFLNGWGECGTDGWRQVYHFGGAIMLSPQKWPFIVIFPQKQYALEEREPSPWVDQEPMVLAILEKTRREYKLDASRLYLTGLSQGGYGTWALASRNPGLFAAIAPVCGWGSKEIAEKLAGMPIWAFHGDADSTVLPQRTLEMKDWIEEAGGSCKLTIYPGVGHNSWDKAYRDENLGEWFLSHRR